MMSHDEAVVELVDLRRGRLEAGRGDALRAHLAGCEECREILETCDLLSDALTGEACRSAAHPTSEEIVSYARADEGIGTADLARIGSHVRGCPSCSREVEASRRATAAGPALFRPAPSARWLAPLAAAASIAALLLAYPAYLGLVRAPTVEGGGPWPGGAVGSIYLEALRSGDRPPAVAKVPMAPARPYVVLLLEPTLAQGTEDAAPFRFSIGAPDGRAVWQADLTAGEIRRHLESSARAVTLLVPSGALKPGRHVLTMVPADRPDQPLLFEAAFDVEE